ncbi:MAG: dCTP deaminase [Nanoarchaeota archaeon]|mgnify:CR=1 FL=1
MILSDRTIKELIRDKKIIIDPYEEKNVQPASVDLRLGNEFLIPDYHSVKIISLGEKLNYVGFQRSSMIVPPHHFVLGTTIEHIEIGNDICGRLDGKSGIGRKGLFIQNAGHINPGFKGKLTLEFYNANEMPLELFSGMEICQLIFQYLDKEVYTGYNGLYQGQSKVTGSK